MELVAALVPGLVGLVGVVTFWRLRSRPAAPYRRRRRQQPFDRSAVIARGIARNKARRRAFAMGNADLGLGDAWTASHGLPSGGDCGAGGFGGGGDCAFD